MELELFFFFVTLFRKRINKHNVWIASW